MVENWKSNLNFPVFFYAALKDNTATSQLNAVNILLAGFPFTLSDASQKTISSSIVSGYINEAKKISEDTCLSFIRLTQEERISRLTNVGISKTDLAVNALIYLLKSDHLIIDDLTKNRLLQLPYTNEPLLFLSEVLLESVKRNNNNLSRPNEIIKKELISFRVIVQSSDAVTTGCAGHDKQEKTSSSLFHADITQEIPIQDMEQHKKKRVALNSSSRCGRCINDDEKEYYILDDYADDDYLESAPSEFIANILYFIVLSCPEKGLEDEDVVIRKKNYLLLKHDRYMNGNDLWSVPFCSYTVQSEDGIYRPKSVGMIRDYYKKNLVNLYADVQANSRQLMFQLNMLSGYSLEDGDTYIEYKNSPSQPDRWKCYYVKEYFVHSLDPSDIINLTDPENLHGYKYFPLSDWKEKKGNIHGIKAIGKTLRFSGGYIPENVAKNIFNQRKLLKNIIEVQPSHLSYVYSGYLFCVDIIDFAYTSAYIYTHSLIHNRVSDSNISDHFFMNITYNFEDQVKEIFLQALLDAGIDKYIIKGGTLIAAFTCKKSSKNFQSVVSLIETIHSKLIAFLPRFETATGVQGTIYFADYFGYGKKLGLNQSEPTFMGEHFERFSSIAYSLSALHGRKLKYTISDSNTYDKLGARI